MEGSDVNFILEQFESHGINASFHYADDTASGEWRLGQAEEARARKLFKDNPGMHNSMREIAKGFLWTLEPKT
jgi:hypothetical protein